MTKPFALAVSVHQPEQVLFVGVPCGVKRYSTARFRGRLGGWRGMVQARLEGLLRHVFAVRFDVADDRVRCEVDEVGRTNLVVGRNFVWSYVSNRKPDTLADVQRALSDLFERRCDAERALRDLRRAGIVTVERA